MSETTTPTLAEALRAYLHAEHAVRAARRALPPDCSAWPETSIAMYLRGYDDARAELAAMKERVLNDWRVGRKISAADVRAAVEGTTDA